MQKCSVVVRLNGSLLNTVPKVNVTPAEILILQHLHGGDAVVDIRPTEFDKKVRQEQEYDRLSRAYDRPAGGFADAPGADDEKSIMQKLFPGALKRLPLTLEEIGIDVTGGADPEPAPKRTRKPSPEKTPEPEQTPDAETDAEPAEGEAEQDPAADEADATDTDADSTEAAE